MPDENVQASNTESFQSRSFVWAWVTQAGNQATAMALKLETSHRDSFTDYLFPDSDFKNYM